jgi:hypothetical protein
LATRNQPAIRGGKATPRLRGKSRAAVPEEAEWVAAPDVAAEVEEARPAVLHQPGRDTAR